MKINGKQKGNRYELRIAKQIADHIGVKYGSFIRRTPGSGSLLCRADLFIHTKYRERFPFFVELKNRKSWHLEDIIKNKWEPYDWFRDAKDKLKIDPEYDFKDPSSRVLLIFTKNNLESLVMMDKDTYYAYHGNLYNYSFYVEDKLKKIVIVTFNEFMEKCVPKYEMEKVEV